MILMSVVSTKTNAGDPNWSGELEWGVGGTRGFNNRYGILGPE
jgi:hypothetical protein